MADAFLYCQVELFYTENLQVFKNPELSTDTSGTVEEVQDSPKTTTSAETAAGVSIDTAHASVRPTFDLEETFDVKKETENLQAFKNSEPSTDTSGTMEDVQETRSPTDSTETTADVSKVTAYASAMPDTEVTSDITRETDNLQMIRTPQPSAITSGVAKDTQDSSGIVSVADALNSSNGKSDAPATISLDTSSSSASKAGNPATAPAVIVKVSTDIFDSSVLALPGAMMTMVPTFGNGRTTPGGIPKDSSCTVCNLKPDGGPPRKRKRLRKFYFHRFSGDSDDDDWEEDGYW